MVRAASIDREPANPNSNSKLQTSNSCSPHQFLLFLALTYGGPKFKKFSDFQILVFSFVSGDSDSSFFFLASWIWKLKVYINTHNPFFISRVCLAIYPVYPISHISTGFHSTTQSSIDSFITRFL